MPELNSQQGKQFKKFRLPPSESRSLQTHVRQALRELQLNQKAAASIWAESEPLTNSTRFERNAELRRNAKCKHSLLRTRLKRTQDPLTMDVALELVNLVITLCIRRVAEYQTVAIETAAILTQPGIASSEAHEAHEAAEIALRKLSNFQHEWHRELNTVVAPSLLQWRWDRLPRVLVPSDNVKSLADLIATGLGSKRSEVLELRERIAAIIEMNAREMAHRFALEWTIKLDKLYGPRHPTKLDSPRDVLGQVVHHAWDPHAAG